MKLDGETKEVQNYDTPENETASGASGEISTSIEPGTSIASEDRKSTGPRTKPGKQRSSQNSLKHGLFARVAVLKGESAAEYRRLLTGLLEDKRPVGKLESVLVEKIAITFWRLRRELGAEGEEIGKNRLSFGELSYETLSPRILKLDLLYRYEQALERNLDRALNQLERLQRARLGQPVAPKIEVTDSLS